MKAVIILCALLGVAVSAPAGKSAYSAYSAPAHVSFAPAAYHHVSAPSYAYAPARSSYYTGPVVTGTLHQSQDTYGQYKYGYSSSDGQDKTESRSGDGGVSGSYSYTSPEGKYIQLSYKADKDGFQAYGDHLPEAPEALEVPDYLADAYREAHGRLAQAYDEAKYRAPASSYDDGSYRKHGATSYGTGATGYGTGATSYGTGAYVSYGAPSRDDGSYQKYAASYDDGSYRPDDEGSYQRYSAHYDDGSYKPSGSAGAYRKYQTVAVSAPTYHHTSHQAYGTAAAYPAKVFYGGAAPAAATHSAVSYSANIGGAVAKAPAHVYAAPAPHAKSAYAYHG